VLNGTDDDDAIAKLNNCDAHNGVTIDSIHLRVNGDDNNPTPTRRSASPTPNTS
jgi:hypothetical protein